MFVLTSQWLIFLRPEIGSQVRAAVAMTQNPAYRTARGAGMFTVESRSAVYGLTSGHDVCAVYSLGKSDVYSVD